ncbi:hypothetical protein [Sphingomonas abietis]|uniref:Uncharacterized protein n=1 Tax=Sphingomonas abietis TaxID=3012344 RepID=A0ABY7NM77_9SPHN|nr:hypothetical protein [Sphingomonas abietis]WBO22458.1 hypothetical protein PBT88_20385 [Sphingomonas abietis]
MVEGDSSGTVKEKKPRSAKAKPVATKSSPQKVPQKRSRVVRNFPASPFEEALSFAKAVLDYGSGASVRRVTLFNHLGKSPESGLSRQIITNANKYNLIKGGYQADILELTPEGKKASDEQIQPRERARARVQLAILDIEPFSGLFQRFQTLRLPAKGALIDAVKEFGVSADAAEEAVDTFIVNLRFVGLLQTLSGADRIITIDHLLDDLPSSLGFQSEPSMIPVSSGQLITSGDAHFEGIAFYITPIGDVGSEQREHSDLFLGSIVEPALESLQLKVIRADQIDRPGVITKQVIEYLFKSRLVIADLSYHNPNVFYELAIRHMLRKPVVQLMRTLDKIPFDVNQVRTISVDTSSIYKMVPQLEAYKSQLAAQVRSVLENPDAVDSPISMYLPASG